MVGMRSAATEMENAMEDETEQLRQAILADMEAPEAELLAEFTDDSPGVHEALHMASFLMRAIEAELMEHQAVACRPEWFSLSHRAFSALFDLYQAIGAAERGAQSAEA